MERKEADAVQRDAAINKVNMPGQKIEFSVIFTIPFWK